MEQFVEYLKSIWAYISSAEVLGTISFGSLLTFIIQIFTKNWQVKKANAKYGAKEAELKAIKESYDKLKEDSEKTIKEITNIYMQSVELVKELHTNALAQNEAMVTAFNNSNLNASAKREVEKILNNIIAPTTEVENQNNAPTPVSNAVNEVVENEVVENESKIIRIK